jgi:hypothetical protein
MIANPSALVGSTSFTTQALNATNNGAWAVYLAPKAGTITKIGVNFTAKTGTAPTYRFGVEGVTPTRQPDSTYKASGNAFVDAANPATGWAWRTLGTSVTVAAGDELAATVRYQSGTVDASNFSTIAVRMGTGTFLAPFAGTLTAGTNATVAGGLPCIALQYDDGTVI